jgi:hypothetical protein
MSRGFRAWLAVAGLGTALGCGGPTEATDTDAPFIAITSPANGATVSGLVLFSATALDGFGIAKVRFLVDGQLLAEDFTAPYQTNWNTLSAGNGPHALRAEAIDLVGNSAFTSISVTVDNSRQ